MKFNSREHVHHFGIDDSNAKARRNADEENDILLDDPRCTVHVKVGGDLMTMICCNAPSSMQPVLILFGNLLLLIYMVVQFL